MLHTNSLLAFTMFAVSILVWASHAGSMGLAAAKSLGSFGVFLAVDGEPFAGVLVLKLLVAEVFNTPLIFNKEKVLF